MPGAREGEAPTWEGPGLSDLRDRQQLGFWDVVLQQGRELGPDADKGKHLRVHKLTLRQAEKVSHQHVAGGRGVQVGVGCLSQRLCGSPAQRVTASPKQPSAYQSEFFWVPDGVLNILTLHTPNEICTVDVFLAFP